ncbi:TetR/AcrR family transcriptional regulator [Meiothermus rufus]|uniref:TetR/AcrR family transcriptional regulator n=1 Tax=Meiothermus rufus TaxID=604332 RepID=UPI000409EF3C|nr:TetR/AcrR family transcriptional regulator [Meiothermus rufus]
MVSRKGRRARPNTRERILQAAIELISREGLEAVSTTRLAQAAGVVQSGFYAHFTSLEECLVSAAEVVGGCIRALLGRSLGELRQAGAADFEGIVRLYQ